jgi:hypothetical protein
MPGVPLRRSKRLRQIGQQIYRGLNEKRLASEVPEALIFWPSF